MFLRCILLVVGNDDTNNVMQTRCGKMKNGNQGSTREVSADIIAQSFQNVAD